MAHISLHCRGEFRPQGESSPTVREQGSAWMHTKVSDVLSIVNNIVLSLNVDKDE